MFPKQMSNGPLARVCLLLCPFSHREKKKIYPFTISSCPCQFGPMVVKRLLGHGSIRGISRQMGLQACMK